MPATTDERLQSRIATFARDAVRRARRADARTEIVFLGDSLVEQFPATPGWVNRGLSGDRLRGPNGDVFDRLGSERLHPNPLAIVVLIGINDLAANTPVASLLESYGHLLSQLAQTAPTARLAVVSLLPTTGVASTLQPGVLQVNAGLRTLAASRGVAYWDLYQAFVDPTTGSAHAGLVARDGIHLTARGYRTMRQWLLAAAPSLHEGALALLPAGAMAASAVATDVLAAYGSHCWASREGATSDADIARHFVKPEVDYLVQYLETGAHVFRDLYMGSRAKFMASNPTLWEDTPGGVKALAARDADLWQSSLARHGASADVMARVAAVHDEIGTSMAVGNPTRIRLLFVGDCLLEDVELLMGADLLRHGMLATVDFITSKSPAEQLRAIRAAAHTTYQGVVYSPLSWEFDQDFRTILAPSPQAMRQVEGELRTILERIEARVRLLAGLFECNVYVHNTAAVLRASSHAKRVVRSVLTHYKRTRARQRIDEFLRRLLPEINAASFEHCYLIDERSAVLDAADDRTLGRFLYYAEAIHPTELSVVVARQLTDFVAASVTLAGKKVVVCDLDQTLWDGVIGEGLGVRHCRDRQETLRTLKTRGVVLAICSKNDPANVRWEGSVLGADDFVASEVSWGPKPVGIGRIQETLNLKAKDFVFIDDRADERAMVAERFPKLVALDPCTESTWRLFRAWAQLLGTTGGDRTAMYQQRAEREKLLAAATDDQESVETFKRLQLRLDIRRSSDKDLTRIHELINRTNQWNLQGSRCAFAEVKAWHESADHRIYTARVKDKFGDMGLVSVCVAAYGSTAIEVQIFVLSCRVFGYGVETLILRQLERDAMARYGSTEVRGFIVPTAHNGPCRDFFSRHGYVEHEGAWQASEAKGSAPDPTWFERVLVADAT